MKSQLILTVLGFAISAQVYAQKISTRSGFVSFFSETPIENIEAVNNQVSSVINTENGDFAFLVQIKAFVFEKALMQEHFNENYMESGQYPKATFKGHIAGFDQIDLTKDGEYKTTFKGIMNIHGVDQKITPPVTITVKDGKVSLQSEFNLKVSDYKIEIPAAKQDNISNELLVTVKVDYGS